MIAWIVVMVGGAYFAAIYEVLDVGKWFSALALIMQYAGVAGASICYEKLKARVDALEKKEKNNDSKA